MYKIFIKSIKRVILIIALFCFFIHGSNIENNLQFDHVGIWVVRNSMINKKEIDQFIDFAKDNGITDLFVQIRGRGDAFYNSDLVEKNKNISPQSFDPLEYVCKVGHYNNLKIHAWFNTYILLSNPKRAISSDHLFKLFPNWTETNYYGQNDSELIYLGRTPKNYEGAYLSPIHPDVNRYLFLLIKEIISKYDIDGIHFDYVRLQGKNWGFNKKGTEMFTKKTGLNFEDFAIDGKYYRNDSLRNTFFKKYSEYRIQAINDLIKRVSIYNKQNNKKIKISAAVKPNPIFAKNNYYQDWLSWIKNDWIDFVVPMNYTKNNRIFNNILADIKNNLDKEEYNKVLVGIGIWKQSPKNSSKKINLVNNQNLSGVVLFSYNTLKKEINYYKNMVKNVKTN
ncbi:MAG: family 10 glycosylhydrolase [Candidatus Marinimicrobia bacterium]|nr:family 10 glycosylhydrolase [Candidatus Neomarinimicrobiota bacterium]